MERIKIQLEVEITAMEGQKLPEKDRLVDQFTDYVYKYFIKDKGHAQMLQVLKVNGESLNKG